MLGCAKAAEGIFGPVVRLAAEPINFQR